jgi:rare lipoprotein A
MEIIEEGILLRMYNQTLHITSTSMLIVFSILTICPLVLSDVCEAQDKFTKLQSLSDGTNSQRHKVGEFIISSDLIETGTATWISNSLHGQVTASGEKYNNKNLVAAHSTLPFGTLVKVTNRDNHRFVVVKINDRKPHSETNIVVVSGEAARQLDMIEKGRVKVKIEIASGQYGIASWYGHPFHGRLTANGEVYDMNKLTAAHKKLPFNTKVRVTNLKNGKAVIVRINDRGPFVEGRIIDLSQKAASMIEMVNAGISMVELSILGR